VTTSNQKQANQPTQEEIIDGLSLDELKATREKLEGAIALKIKRDAEKRTKELEEQRIEEQRRIEEAQRLENEKRIQAQQPKINNPRPQPVKNTPNYNERIDDDENRQPQVKIRGKVTSYDASGEPIMDKPQKGFMGIIGNPILLIMLMGIISWAMIQIFAGSSGGGTKMQTAINMLETERGQDVAAVAKLDTTLKALQDQVNTVANTVNGLPKSSTTDATIAAINKRLDDLQNALSTTNSNVSTATNSIKQLQTAITALQPH
jgi:DNA repair exonuclease SbcCD ATPase subunit